MLKIFKKDYSNINVLQELLHKNFNKEWLKEGLDSKKININYLDDNGNSYLMKCIKVGKFKAAIWLIENGIDVTLENDENETAFNYAINRNNHEILNMILENHEIDVNSKDNENRTLLQNAVVQGNNGVAKILIKYNADLNNVDMNGRNVVYDALSYGDENFIKYLSTLEGIDLDIIDEKGDTVMLHPQVIKDDDIAKDMLKAGADPTIKNKTGNSFLLTTALRGEDGDSVIDVLLENSGGTHDSNKIVKELVDISSQLPEDDKEKRDKLLRTAKKTMKSGAKVNSVKGDNNESGLFDAVRLNDFELSSFLLTSGMDPNLQNSEGNTALSEAIYDGMKNIKIIRLLLEHGATPNIRNHRNETLYEILNNIILHNHGTKTITDYELLFKIEKNGHYFEVLKVILKNNKESLDYLDSKGNPLFFIPLLFDYFQLYKIYISHGANVHLLNKTKHNIFYAYVLKVFQNNVPNKNFRDNISSLLSSKVDKNSQDGLGWTILHKVIATKCNEDLFKVLTNIVSFDYKKTDNLGRTVMHSAVWSKKDNIAKILFYLDKDLMNIDDDYGLLPIKYAALLGNQSLLLFFLSNGSNVKSSKVVTDLAVKKFRPMLRNLIKIKEDIKDPDLLRKLDIVIKQTMKDFRVI